MAAQAGTAVPEGTAAVAVVAKMALAARAAATAGGVVMAPMGAKARMAAISFCCTRTSSTAISTESPNWVQVAQVESGEGAVQGAWEDAPAVMACALSKAIQVRPEILARPAPLGHPVKSSSSWIPPES
jgi:hypothetical protein